MHLPHRTIPSHHHTQPFDCKEDGWTMHRPANRKHAKEIRDVPYVHGDANKFVYLLSSGGYSDLKVLYMALLLQAQTHRKPVPHLADNDVYRELLGLEPKPRKRKGKFMSEADTWEPAPASRPRGKSGKAKRARPVPAPAPAEAPVLGSDSSDSHQTAHRHTGPAGAAALAAPRRARQHRSRTTREGGEKMTVAQWRRSGKASRMMLPTTASPPGDQRGGQMPVPPAHRDGTCIRDSHSVVVG